MSFHPPKPRFVPPVFKDVLVVAATIGPDSDSADSSSGGESSPGAKAAFRQSEDFVALDAVSDSFLDDSGVNKTNDYSMSIIPSNVVAVAEPSFFDISELEVAKEVPASQNPDFDPVEEEEEQGSKDYTTLGSDSQALAQYLDSLDVSRGILTYTSQGPITSAAATPVSLQVYSQSFFDDQAGGDGDAKPVDKVPEDTQISPPSKKPPKAVKQKMKKPRKISEESIDEAVELAMSRLIEESNGKRKNLNKEKELNDANVSLASEERIRHLQKVRTSGTWVECCKVTCGKWRLLPDVQDPSMLPDDWTCEDNPNLNFNNCSYPQEDFKEAEVSFVENKFNVGSVVWAKLGEFPWWPAFVDDDPDNMTFFWTAENSAIPFWYHVVFFHRLDQQVSRAWIKSKSVLLFRDEENKDKAEKWNRLQQGMSKDTAARLLNATKDAEIALKMELQERRETYCFMGKPKGKWGLPWGLNLSNEEGNEQG